MVTFPVGEIFSPDKKTNILVRRITCRPTDFVRNFKIPSFKFRAVFAAGDSIFTHVFPNVVPIVTDV